MPVPVAFRAALVACLVVSTSARAEDPPATSAPTAAVDAAAQSAAAPAHPAKCGVLAAATHDRVKRALLPVLVDGQIQGNAWLVGAPGRAATCLHVVKSGKRVELLGPGDKPLLAAIVARFPTADLAVLQLAAPPEGTEPLELATDLPPLGTPIFHFGLRTWRLDTVVQGRVASAEATFDWMPDHFEYVDAVYVEGPTPKGTSGGPWVDCDGRVVGMQAGRIDAGSTPSGFGWFVPAATIATCLAADRPRPSATLAAAFDSIWEFDPPVRASFPSGALGLHVSIVSPGPLTEAGIRQGDLVIAADGNRLTRPVQLVRLVRAKKPGDEMLFVVLSPGAPRPRNVKVRLGDSRKR